MALSDCSPIGLVILSLYAIFRRNATHSILLYAIVVSVSVYLSVCVCVCRICGPQKNCLI